MSEYELYLEDKLLKAQEEIKNLKKEVETKENRVIELEHYNDLDFQNQVTSLNSILSKTDMLWWECQENERRLKEVSVKLYGVVLHLVEVAKSSNNIILVGPGLYSEAVEAIQEYEKL